MQQNLHSGEKFLGCGSNVETLIYLIIVVIIMNSIVINNSGFWKEVVENSLVGVFVVDEDLKKDM
ncbi:MAG: hypothetical protein PWQ40_1512 [Archaeoglobus sp.]|nr:hypothetical protein [Archaeoglobus sp.]